jgi:hypothetical protein
MHLKLFGATDESEFFLGSFEVNFDLDVFEHPQRDLDLRDVTIKVVRAGNKRAGHL